MIKVRECYGLKTSESRALFSDVQKYSKIKYINNHVLSWFWNEGQKFINQK